MTCECVTWCRVPDAEENTYGQRFPMSRHHPRCAEYRDEEFVVLTANGVPCVVTPQEAESILGEADEPYAVERVRLAPDQVNALPEFTGF